MTSPRPPGTSFLTIVARIAAVDRSINPTTFADSNGTTHWSILYEILALPGLCCVCSSHSFRPFRTSGVPVSADAISGANPCLLDAKFNCQQNTCTNESESVVGWLKLDMGTENGIPCFRVNRWIERPSMGTVRSIRLCPNDSHHGCCRRHCPFGGCDDSNPPLHHPCHRRHSRLHHMVSLFDGRASSTHIRETATPSVSKISLHLRQPSLSRVGLAQYDPYNY